MTKDIPLTRIAVALDGSESSYRAAEYAIKLAKISDAEVIFMHAVVNPGYLGDPAAGVMITGYIEKARQQAETWYANAGKIASQNGVKFSAETILDVVSISDSIVNYAESKNADLIVIGTKGRTGIKRVLLGSVANGVVTHASCPVLVTR